MVGTEALEIVSTLNATSAASYSMLITDAVGKAAGVLQHPQPTDLFVILQGSSGLPRAAQLGNISVPAGNVTLGGVAGQVYMKNSATNFDSSFTTVIPSLTQ